VFIYFLSTLFTTAQAALLVVIFLYLFGSLVLPLVFLILAGIESTKAYADVLRWCFCPIPIYDVGKGFYEIIISDLGASFGASAKDPLSADVAGYYLMSLCISIPVYWFLLFLIESRILGSAVNKLCGNCCRK